MLKILPVVLILLLITGGLFWWRFSATEQNLASPTAEEAESPIEVPKTLPGASLDDRVKALEDSVTSVVNKINTPKSQTDSSLDSRLNNVESAITELKARVSSLEKASPVPVSTSSKAPLYIPLGSGGQISDVNWSSLGAFQASIDPSQYAGYSNMQLEVTIRLNQPGGTAYARLYNNTNSSVVSSEVSTTSTSATIATSSGFTLSSGAKTYILQAKSSDGSQVFIDNARIKVNF